MTDLPSGTVTFLFTDIEGSTQLWERHPDTMRLALARHNVFVRDAIEAHRGKVFKTVGDAFCAVFPRVEDAVAAAMAFQQRLQTESWPTLSPLRVRAALHTGSAHVQEGDYFGPPLNRIARLLDAGHGGQTLLSQVTADLARVALPPGASLRDLGAHRLKDLQQPERIYELQHAGRAAEFPPLRSLEAFAHNLPRQLTSFIGREREIAAVKALLVGQAGGMPRAPLLTLTGAGGCGKTRLALQVAAEVVDAFADGVWLVELAALADPALVPQTVAAELGVKEEPGRPLGQTLVEHLRAKSLLLVLDNCEHLLDACAGLAESLLQGCPRLGILASSREGLGIAGEQTYRVPSLSLPAPGEMPAPERLAQFEGVRLFVERARLSQPGFVVTAANAPAILQVCRRLDGIPLAIELAAARVTVLPVGQLAGRLDDRFRLLTGGSRTALPRQQTLRALIDWSYDLLTEPERMLLRRLAVFSGGWTLEAAEAVCSAEGFGVEGSGYRAAHAASGALNPVPRTLYPEDVLDLLSRLLDKSLVVAEDQDGEARYRLLETVRQYARDRLLGAGETESIRARHRDWYLGLVERAQPELFGSEQVAWLNRLAVEHDNLRGALEWSAGQVPVRGDPLSGSPNSGQRSGDEEWARTRVHIEAGLRMVLALEEFSLVRGYRSEWGDWLETFSRWPAPAIDARLWANAVVKAGLREQLRFDFARAMTLGEEGLVLFRDLGDKQGIVTALEELGEAVKVQGDRERARRLWEERLALCRELGDSGGIAEALSDLGWLARLQGDDPQAIALGEESAALFRELGDKRRLVGGPCDLLAVIRLEQRDHERAASACEEALAISRDLGDQALVAHYLLLLGWLALRREEYERAAAHGEESLTAARAIGAELRMGGALRFLGTVASRQREYDRAACRFRQSLALNRGWLADANATNAYGTLWLLAGGCFKGLAEAAHARGFSERSAVLLGAVEALREELGLEWEERDSQEMASTVAAVRAALGETGFADRWARGKALTRAHAVAYALEEGP